MYVLVVKEHVRSKRCQQFAFLDATHEEGFIDGDTPSVERSDDSFVGRTVSRGDKRSSDGRRRLIANLVLYE